MPGEADWLRERLEELERIERPSASDGKRRAAEWLVGQFAELGTEARVEAEDAHGTYWWPLGLGAALGVLGAALALRGRRLLGVFIAHHDAPHSGIVFHPGPAKVAGRLGLIEKTDTSPPLMWPVVGGPLLAALGAITGKRLAAKIGLFFSAGSVAAMTNIGTSEVVPGANDNGSSVVALLALARRFAAEPPQGVRVVLLSTGSEESFSEGMKAWGERHFPELPKESTLFLCLESLGSPHLLILRAEGFLKLYEFSPRALAFMDNLAEEMEIPLVPNLRVRAGTDGLESLANGYETAVLCSCDDLKQASNYHWPTDVAANIDYTTLEEAINLSQQAIRHLSNQWL